MKKHFIRLKHAILEDGRFSIVAANPKDGEAIANMLGLFLHSTIKIQARYKLQTRERIFNGDGVEWELQFERLEQGGQS